MTDTDNDLPNSGTVPESVDAPMTFDEGVNGIADLLKDPETDLQETTEAQHDAAADDATDPDADMAEGEEAPEDDTAEDVETETADEADGSDETEYAGGRFAADNAKVKLDDGTTITIAELKRNNLFQRDYTRKTTELAQEREQVTRLKSEVDEYAQKLNESRDYLAWFAETYLPADPGPYKGSPNDPVAYLEHMQRREQAQMVQQAFEQFKSQTEAQTAKQRAEAEKQAKEKLSSEREALVRTFPALKDPQKEKSFWDNLKKGAQERYGLDPQLIDTIGDHRMVRILHDALEGARLRQAAPQVKQQVEQKPKIITGSKRQAPQNAARREAELRKQRLRETGDFRAGVASLMDLEL